MSSRLGWTYTYMMDNERGASFFFRNDGRGQFAEVAGQLGLSDSQSNGRGVALLDGNAATGVLATGWVNIGSGLHPPAPVLASRTQHQRQWQSLHRFAPWLSQTLITTAYVSRRANVALATMG